MLFAQATVQVIDWYQVVIQGGSFTLLAYVVAILGPRLYKMAREEHQRREDAHRTERKQRDDAFYEAIVLLQSKTDERASLVASSIKAQTNEFSQAIGNQTDVLRKSIGQAVQNGCKYSTKPEGPRE